MRCGVSGVLDSRDGERPIEQTVGRCCSCWRLAGWRGLPCSVRRDSVCPAGTFHCRSIHRGLFSTISRTDSTRDSCGNALSALVRTRRLTARECKAAAVVVLLVVMGWVVVQERYAFRSREDDRDLFAFITYLHAATPATALIETYDSELFLFLNRRYTYALPQVSGGRDPARSRSGPVGHLRPVEGEPGLSWCWGSMAAGPASTIR